MQYLVTGGAGFIGSHFVDALLSRDHDVVVLDDFSTGSHANLRDAVADRRCTVHRGSASDARIVDDLVAAADVVLHFAAAVGVRLVLERTADCIERNLATAQTVLQAAGRTRTPVVFASSSEVYGTSERVPFAETDTLEIGTTTTARWSYAATKALGEFLAFTLARERQLPVLCTRLFNTVGPRQSARYGMVLPRFVRQALVDEPITVYGDGAQRRCFSFVDDVVEMVFRLIDTPRAWGQVVNVGSDRQVTILELANLVRTLCESGSEIRLTEPDIDAPFAEPTQRVPDLTRFTALVGAPASTPLETIVARVIEHQRQLIGIG